MITERELRVAGASYLSALGYYVGVRPEIPTHEFRPDVVAVPPICARRNVYAEVFLSAGPGPLLRQEWSLRRSSTPPADEESLLQGLSRVSEGWIESRSEMWGAMWAIDDAHTAGQECEEPRMET